MTTKSISASSFATWLNKASNTDCSVRRERRRLWTALVKLTEAKHDDRTVEIPLSDYMSLNLFLTAKQEQINDPSRLAYATLLVRLVEELHELNSEDAQVIPSSLNESVTEEKETP